MVQVAVEFIFHLLFEMKAELDEIYQLGLCQDVWSFGFFVCVFFGGKGILFFSVVTLDVVFPLHP